MRIRTLLYLFAGLIVAACLIGGATAVQTGNSGNYHVWLHAHIRTPLLWMVDGCALVILIGIGLFGSAFGSFNEHSRALTEDHSEQIEKLIARTEELSQLNSDYSERISGLEAEAEEREQAHDKEIGRLTRQAFQLLQGQVDANARQLDAVNVAIQYQRADLNELRQNLGSATLNLSPAPAAAIQADSTGTMLSFSEVGDRAVTDGSAPPEIGEHTDGLLGDQTANAGSTLVLGVDFEVGVASEAAPISPSGASPKKPDAAPAGGSPPGPDTYPVRGTSWQVRS